MTTERSIIFSPPMVVAILEARKSQTRRVVKPQPDRMFDPKCKSALDGWLMACPFGKPGDRLWVREKFALFKCDDDQPPSACSMLRRFYWTDHGLQTGTNPRIGRWRSPIHMPRWHSRIDIEIVNVRIQRVNEISEADAIAEGVTWPIYESFCPVSLPKQSKCGPVSGPARIAYKTLWERLHCPPRIHLASNSPNCWMNNPWVWVIEFTPILYCNNNQRLCPSKTESSPRPRATGRAPTARPKRSCPKGLRRS